MLAGLLFAPGKHPVQLCFFTPGPRVGGYTEVSANTLLGSFQLLGLGEVSVSNALVRRPLICWMWDEATDSCAGPFVTYPDYRPQSWLWDSFGRTWSP